jgi:hypothetical protein
VVSIPEEDTEPGEFGVAARVDVTAGELRGCADALARARGGGGAEPRTVSGFVVLEGGGPERRANIAYREGGLLVVGKGGWFDAMLGAAEGTRPGLAAAAAHTALRVALTDAEGWRSPTVLVTALLPRALRDRIKREMGAEVSAADAETSAMAGVLGVAAAGLAVRACAAGGQVDARAELVCDAEEECAAVEALILRKRLEASKDMSLRLVGLGPLFDSLEVVREGARVRATVSVSADALAQTIERVVRLRGAGGSGGPGPGPGGGAR